MLLTAGVGGWLMFAPDFFGSTGRASDSDRLAGALVVTFALVATAEVARSLRLLNVLFGVWLLPGPWLLDGFTPTAQRNHVVCGVTLFVFSVPSGRIYGRYGHGQRYIV